MFVLASLVVMFIASLVWYDKFSGNKNHRTYKNMPGPPTIPVLGNAHDFIGSAVDFINYLHNSWQKYGRRVRIAVGHDIRLLLSDPKDVEVVLTSNELLDKSKDYDYLHVWLGQGLLTSTGDRWRRHRKFLTPSFHFSILRHFVPIFDARTDTFVSKLAAHAHGRPVDVYPLVTRCTLDQLSESAMGTSTEDQTDKNLEYVESVKQLTEILNDRMKNAFLRPDFIFRLTSKHSVFVKALKVVQDYTTTMIKQRKAILKERGVDLTAYTKEEDDIGKKKCIAFLDLLLLSEVDGKKLDETSIKNEVDTFLFEGHDTTASGISFTIYLLASNPEIQEKLFEEQRAIFSHDSNRATEFRDLQEMKFLELALKESLRIYPPVPFVGRYIKKDVYINDMLVPTGTDIGINIFSMNRDPELFPDPLVFRPERFLPEEVSKRNPYSNVTFSAGPRNCIGQRFAMYEMKMTLSKLIRHYRFSSSDTPPLLLAGDVVLKSANGIHVCVHKRE